MTGNFRSFASDGCATLPCFRCRGKIAFVKQTKNFWARFRVRAGYPVAAIYLVLAAPTFRWMAIGAVIAAFGLITRAAAAGHLRKDQELATTGPYSRTRNPLYLGSALLAAGFVVAGHSLWAGVVVAVYFIVFYYAAIRTEEAHLRARFGFEFEAYSARVSKFFPSFHPIGSEPSSPKDTVTAPFSWAQYRRLRMWLRARSGY